MKIVKVTFTGADDKIQPFELAAISKEYPLVEWGILFSRHKEEQDRYPSALWRERVVREADIRLSAHFCGWYSKEVIEENNFSLISNLPPQYQRVQLNYNFSCNREIDLRPIIQYAENNPNRSIIFQWNKANAYTLDNLISYTAIPLNIHFLHDESGGLGKELELIPPPIPFGLTGYAGGINPLNIDKFVTGLLPLTLCEKTWLDMEAGVRTNNNFDLGKCIQVLNIADRLITEYEHKNQKMTSK